MDAVKKHTSHGDALEPRVAKLETGLEILTRDVTTLAQVVREQSSSLEHELQRLAVAVTQASGPRQTDWSVIISGILLIMAIGSAVFWPLNQTAQNNKTDLQTVTAKFEEHQKLNSHPVGVTLINRLEEQLKVLAENTANNLAHHVDYDNREFAELDTKLQKEYQLMNEVIKQKQAELEKEMVMRNDKLSLRIDDLERLRIQQQTLDEVELRAWRAKANNLTLPTPK